MLKQIFFIGFMVFLTLLGTAQNTLDDYIHFAKQNNPQIADNKNQIQLNQLEGDRLSAQYLKPQVGVSANYLFAPIYSTDANNKGLKLNPDLVDNYYGYDLAASNGGTYQGLVNLNVPLFNQSSYASYKNQTDINQQVNKNNIGLIEHDVEKLVTDQYLICILNKQQLLFTDSLLKLIDNQILIVKKMVENSFMKQSELSLLTIEYQNTLITKSNLTAVYRSSLMDLNILCGLNDTTLIMLSDVDLTLRPTIENSQYLEKYQLDSLTLTASQQVFETKYKPQFSFYSNAGLNAVYAPTLPYRFGVSAGLNFTWNLYDGNQKSIVNDKTALQLETVSLYKENFMTQNELRSYKLLTEIQTYEQRKLLTENQLKEYNNLLVFYTQEILQGQLSIINYVTTLKNMAAVKRDYLVLETNRLLLINAYNYWNW